MSAKSDRNAARETVAADHEAELALLLERVAAAIDEFREGGLSAFYVDRVMFQYSRAAKALWTFCNVKGVESAASAVRDGVRIDWWERGAPRTT